VIILRNFFLVLNFRYGFSLEEDLEDTACNKLGADHYFLIKVIQCKKRERE